MAFVGHDERVAEENAEHPVGGDRIGLCHDDHAGPEQHVAVGAADVVGADMRAVGDDVDAVALRRARLHALVAEEPARVLHRLGVFAGRDLYFDGSSRRVWSRR